MKSQIFLIVMAAAAVVLLICSISGSAAAAAVVSALVLSLSGAVALIHRGDADTTMRRTLALPDGAATTTSLGLDTGNTARGDLVATAELLLAAPALNTTQLPDTETMIYDVFHSDASDFTGEVLLEDNVITQTGASSAGAAAAEARIGLPSNTKRYVRLKATNSGAGDATGATATLSIKAG